MHSRSCFRTLLSVVYIDVLHSRELEELETLTRPESLLLILGKRLLASHAAVEVGRKRLLRNGRDSARLASPFLLWGALVIIIYAVSHAMLLEEGILLVSASWRCLIRA